ncbi:MAG TPA: hypothetical protein PLA88_08940, partial [Bacteroidales bacterium]|nr:hypothetical protein [Bacteroidales bacterium]
EYMYSPDLGSAIVAAGLAETEGEMKEKFIEDFRNQFFATAPKIDAGKLIRFLLQPGETLEIPFEGSISSSFECQQYQKFKGLIKVYGNHVYRFVNE